MTGLHQFFVFLLATAFIQSLVLTTGFGSSIMLRIVRRPGDIWLFGGFMTAFSVLTVLIAYPLDSLIGTGQAAKLLRPLMMVAIAAVLYALVSFWLHRSLPSVYRRVSRLLPLAAFNNLVIGIALIINHQFALGLSGAVGLSLGACLGFVLLTWLTAEGMERMDNPDMPQAFRGMPATLVYLGILAPGPAGLYLVVFLCIGRVPPPLHSIKGEVPMSRKLRRGRTRVFHKRKFPVKAVGWILAAAVIIPGSFFGAKYMLENRPASQPNVSAPRRPGPPPRPPRDLLRPPTRRSRTRPLAAR